MKPIVPMEPASSDTIPVGDEWAATLKWDGVRILCYGEKNATSLYNRHGRARTLHYPELLDFGSYCNAQSVILDGEVIALGDDGRPSFHEVMRRDGLRRMEKVPYVRQTTPIAYMVFDILFRNGQWVTALPFDARMELLQSTVRPNTTVQIVTAHADGAAMFEVVNQHDLEGIVVKRRDSPYHPGTKTGLWQKIKNYKDLNAVIGGFTMDRGSVNAVLLGLYRASGQLFYIGHAGSGKLAGDEWRGLAEAVKKGKMDKMPFVHLPPRLAGATWTTPRLCVKVKFIEWTHDASLRQPTIQAVVDVDPERCTFD